MIASTLLLFVLIINIIYALKYNDEIEGKCAFWSSIILIIILLISYYVYVIGA